MIIKLAGSKALMLLPFHLRQTRHLKGFSLLEIMLTTALIGLILVTSIPAYRQLQLSNDLSIAVSTLSQTLRLVQLKSQAIEQGNGWGIHIATSTIMIFKGSSFDTRDQTLDENFSFGSGVAISEPADVFFTPLSGTPLTPTAWQLKGGDQTRSVAINSLGILNF